MLHLRASPTNGRRMYGLTQAIYQTGVGGGPPVPLQLETDLGAMTLRFSSVSSAGFPQMAIWTGNSHAVVAVAGIQSAAEGLRFFDGWVGPGISTRFPGRVNFDAMQRWEAVRSAVWAALEGHADHITVAGHSGGGVIATMIAGEWRTTKVGRTSDLTTFGTPRGGDHVFMTWRESLSPVDVVLERDVVPCLPGTMLEFPMPHALLTGPQSSSLSLFARPLRYLHVSSGGVFTFTRSVPEVTIPASTATYSQLVAFLSGSLRPHFLLSYRDRFAQFEPVQRSDDAAVSLRPHNAVVPPEPIAGGEWRAQREVLRREREVSTAPAQGARGTVRVRVRRDGKRYCVLVEGTAVFFHRRRRTCVSVARVIRRMDSAMGTQGAWAVDDIWPDSWRRPLAV